MNDLIDGLSRMSYFDILADAHGLIAMLVLVLFGGAFVLLVNPARLLVAQDVFKSILSALVVSLAALDMLGIYVYGAYRAEGGPRAILKSSADTAWLHEIIFEHKEFLAFAPWLLVLVALSVFASHSASIADSKNLNALRLVQFSVLMAFMLVLVVAGEGVLVTKVAPIR